MGQGNSTDEVKCALLLSLIGEDALRMYNTFKFTSDEGHNNNNKYADVVTALRNYCTPKKRLRTGGSNFDQFLTMKMLVRYCEYGEQKESIVLGRIAQHCRVVELNSMQAKQISAASSSNTEQQGLYVGAVQARSSKQRLDNRGLSN
ncbi:hypothetical protein PR048_004309 [Dryococelus australis]|uniref:Uncharacterized protein n=1 Tax=Dryococelus australis TaxID=614101 RepID=A0ABQ9I5X1_9NEOP|nr:hypothetical protein PR048_004309 [Dryococelus australis]